MVDHLESARHALAEGDKQYAKAGEHIQAWLDEDGMRTQQQAADQLGISQRRVSELLALSEGVPSKTAADKRHQHARSVMRDDPESVFETMTPDELADSKQALEAAEVLVGSVRIDRPKLLVEQVVTAARQLADSDAPLSKSDIKRLRQAQEWIESAIQGQEVAGNVVSIR